MNCRGFLLEVVNKAGKKLDSGKLKGTENIVDTLPKTHLCINSENRTIQKVAFQAYATYFRVILFLFFFSPTGEMDTNIYYSLFYSGQVSITLTIYTEEEKIPEIFLVVFRIREEGERRGKGESSEGCRVTKKYTAEEERGRTLIAQPTTSCHAPYTDEGEREKGKGREGERKIKRQKGVDSDSYHANSSSARVKRICSETNVKCQHSNHILSCPGVPAAPKRMALTGMATRH